MSQEAVATGQYHTLPDIKALYKPDVPFEWNTHFDSIVDSILPLAMIDAPMFFNFKEPAPLEHVGSQFSSQLDATIIALKPQKASKNPKLTKAPKVKKAALNRTDVLSQIQTSDADNTVTSKPIAVDENIEPKPKGPGGGVGRAAKAKSALNHQ